MMRDALGLPLDMAKKLLDGQACAVLQTRPPRRPDKSGSMRVVRVQERGGTVVLTVSPFEDALEESK